MYRGNFKEVESIPEKKRRSIGQRLERCKSPITAMEILQEWLTDYNNEQHTITRKLREALNAGNASSANQLINQLESTGGKRNEAIQTIIKRLEKMTAEPK